MKMLLTSAGITNKSLANALRGLVGSKIRFAFIPTAAHHSVGDKGWLIKNYMECQKLGSIDIVDISAVGKDVWLPKLKAANVIVIGGGHGILHLLRWMKKSGLERMLPGLLRDRVYVGISSGSMIMQRSISTYSAFLYSKNKNKVPKGLGYVDFSIVPHLNSKKYPKTRNRYLKEFLRGVKGNVYALDDNSGIVFSNGKIRVVSEGKWKEYQN